VAVPCDERREFRPDVDALERAVTPRARVLILNSPVNPTGACYTRDDLLAIADVARRHDLWIISDEIYDRLTYDGARHTSVATLSEDAGQRTLLVNGMSKSYAMTGWRVGYAAGPAAVIEAAVRLQGQSTSNITSIAQKAALAAITGDHSFFPGWLAEFDRRRRFLLDRLRRVPGLSCTTPRAAYYVFANVSALFGKSAGGVLLRSDLDVAQALLEQAHVAVVPGEPFGSAAHVRFSYATSMEKLSAALDRVDRWAASAH
jgi:aspartate aminotransferase